MIHWHARYWCRNGQNCTQPTLQVTLRTYIQAEIHDNNYITTVQVTVRTLLQELNQLQDCTAQYTSCQAVPPTQWYHHDLYTQILHIKSTTSELINIKFSVWRKCTLQVVQYFSKVHCFRMFAVSIMMLSTHQISRHLMCLRWLHRTLADIILSPYQGRSAQSLMFVDFMWCLDSCLRCLKSEETLWSIHTRLLPTSWKGSVVFLYTSSKYTKEGLALYN